MTITKQVDYDYFDWLVSQIDVPRHKTFGGLFEVMHNIEFVWLVPHDDNRASDGLALRREFLNGRKKTINLQAATMLEVLVALSRRTSFILGGTSSSWAWRLIKNIGLNKKADPLTDEDVEKIKDVLDRLIWRTYLPNGKGGFFPLDRPEEDQTKLEIWMQMNKYALEKSPL
jgi:hypothetical protein